MAAHSNRSPSPLSSRSTNPNPRNSEANPAPRRSFSGNNPFGKPSVLTNPRRFDPITPANSPSDLGRRRSVGRECTGSSQLKDYEEKENDEKDQFLKASKIQSQAKGSKNFMAPTISAASKFTPSPRKKVLVERNDPVRTSISLSDGKAMFFSTMMSSNVSEELESKSEIGHHQNHKNGCSLDSNVSDSNKAVKEGPPVSKPSKKVSFSNVPSESECVTESLSESVVTDSESLKLESSLKNKVSCSSVSASIAQPDADPSLPPYDPKTNYLSPRPQFLHYKPNPRIGILLNKEKGLDRDDFEGLDYSLMDEVMSENFSDSEGTEESQTEDPRKAECDVDASADMVIGLEESENDPYVSEPSESLPVSTTVNDAIAEDNHVEQNEKKPWRFSRLMCFPMLMMFVIACASISATRSPLHDEFVFKDLSLSDLSKFYHQSRASAKVNLDCFVEHVNQLSIDSVAFISKLANELGKGGKLGPLQFMNLSDLQMSTSNGRHLLNEENEELVENLEEDELDTGIDKFEEETNAEADTDQNFGEVFDAQENDVLETKEVPHDSAESVSEYSEDIQSQRGDNSADLVAFPADQESELEATVVETAPERAETEKSHDDDINLGSSSELEAAIGIAPKIAELEKSHDELEAAVEVASDKAQTEESHDDGKVNSLSECVQSLPTLESPPSEDKLPARYVMGASSLFAALAVVAALICHYKRTPNTADVVQADPLSNNSINAKHINHEKPISKNWETEVDETGESCPSAMSSFQKGSSYYSKKETRGAGEVQSTERKTRKYSKRESLASSSEYSTGSPSYGSFTTYERIPFKNANGDEEIITPVRRSSRIRSHQATSP